MAEPTVLKTLADLDALTSTHKYVVLDFTAAWCPPCKAIAPLFGKLAAEYARPGRLAFAKVDVDEAPEVAQRFAVASMPTFLFLVDGRRDVGVDVRGRAVGGGGVVQLDGRDGHVAEIRGADPRNLVALVQTVAELASAAAAAAEAEGEAGAA